MLPPNEYKEELGELSTEIPLFRPIKLFQSLFIFVLAVLVLLQVKA